MNQTVEAVAVAVEPVADAKQISELMCRVFTGQELGSGDRRVIANSLMRDRKAMIAMYVEAKLREGYKKTEGDSGAYGMAAAHWDCSASTARLAHGRYYRGWSSVTER